MDRVERMNFKERGDVKTAVKESEHVREAMPTRVIYPLFKIMRGKVVLKARQVTFFLSQEAGNRLD